MGLGLAELIIILFVIVIIGSVVGIGVLCWVWMKNSRASQRHVESQNSEIVELLREQNALLRNLSEKR
jgi:flagellar basal body-associated protein FliL